MGSWITRNLAQQVDLLKRHAEILETLNSSVKPLGIIKLSKMTGHSPHLVRYSLRELENANVIKPSPRGCTLTPQAKSFITKLNKEIDDLATDLNGFSTKMKGIDIRGE